MKKLIDIVFKSLLLEGDSMSLSVTFSNSLLNASIICPDTAGSFALKTSKEGLFLLWIISVTYMTLGRLAA